MPLILLYRQFIPELRGRSLVGNIVLSLLVVHRAEFWLPLAATLLCNARPRRGSDTASEGEMPQLTAVDKWRIVG